MTALQSAPWRKLEGAPRTLDLRLLDERLPPADWDARLAAMGGHPLQSSLWGNAKRAVEGRVDHRLAYTDADGMPRWLIRVEERRAPVLGIVGWAPRGPTAGSSADVLGVPGRLRDDLGERGVRLLVSDPYIEAADNNGATDDAAGAGAGPRTIWVDLTVGIDAAFARLKGKVRTSIRSAAKKGVTTVETRDVGEVSAFVDMCKAVSRIKSFHLDLNPELVIALMDNVTPDARCRLFVARREGSLLAGALIMTLGRHWHFFWGGTDRSAGDFDAGVALHWAIMETAIADGARRYDLEGIDYRANPSTGIFKRKLGGVEVELPGHTYLPLGIRGKAMALALAARRAG